jgi:hypothetical protein
MSHVKEKGADLSASQITTEQMEALRSRLAALKGEPLGTVGTTSVCPDCGGRMTVTNDLNRSVAVPGVVFVVSHLPGAQCGTCGASELDGSGVGILESTIPREILADYETAVTHSSGATLGTYFKMDLARVLNLVGNEKLFWKIVDRDHALVRVARQAREPRRRRDGVPRRRRRSVVPPTGDSLEAAKRPVKA